MKRFRGGRDRFHWEDGKKVCPWCERLLNPNEFEEDNERWDGLKGHCKRCIEYPNESRRWAREERELTRQEQFKSEKDEMMRVTMDMKGGNDED